MPRRFLPLALLATMGAAPVQTPTAAEITKQVQTHYDAVRDFSADFVMTFKGLLQRQTSVEMGDVKVKKPNRMWWNYTSPDKRKYVANGVTMRSYFQEDKLGTEEPLPKASEASTALLFLAGKGDLTRDFTAALAPTQPEGQWQLVLTPRKKQDDYNTLTLIVDRRTFSLRGLTLAGDDGSQAFAFKNFRENIGLKDADFVFDWPRGTVVNK